MVQGTGTLFLETKKDGDEYVCGYEVNEVINLINNGVNVILRDVVSTPGMVFFYYPTSMIPQREGNMVQFFNYVMNNTVIFNPNGTFTGLK